MLGLHPPERVAVVDVATGAVEQRRLPGGTLCHGPLMASGVRALLPKPGEQYLHSARAGAFWALRVRPGHVRASVVREISGAGRTLFRARRRPPAGYPSGAVAGGIVFESRGRGADLGPAQRRAPPRRRGVAGGLLRARQRLVRRPLPAAAHPRRRPRAGRGAAAARPSCPAAAGSLPTAPGSPWRSPAPAPGSRSWTSAAVPSSCSPCRPSARGVVAWSPSGDWLYAAAQGGRVAAYSPGDAAVVTVPVRLRGEVIDLAVAG